MSGGSKAFGLIGAAWLAAGLTASSCSAAAKGSIILSVSTDMQTPKDLDVVSIFVSTAGVAKFDFLGRVRPDGTVALPSTLAIVEPDDASAEVRIRVVGFQSQSGAEEARVLRDVLTTVPHQRTVLLRVPLSFLDDGSATGTLPAMYVPDTSKGVADGTTGYDPTSLASLKPVCDFSKRSTMIAGECADAGVDSSKLPAYDPTEVFGDAGINADGTPGACFDVARCFAAASPVQGIDRQHCTFSVPQGVDPSKMNLALATKTTGACVGGTCFVPLEDDPGEGWSAKGGTVTMLPGVCKRLDASTKLYQAASGACAPKAQALPVCQLASGSDGGTFDASPDVTTMDATADATAEAGCMAGATRCSATLTATPEQCDDAGAWQPQAACANQACVAGACAGTCSPGSKQCADRVTPTLCDGAGTPKAQTACSAATPYCYLGACVATFPSCQGGGKGADATCGAGGSTDCCASLPVTGGTFTRDGLASYPATVATFSLDAYEVTVGRFRKFVDATAPSNGPAWAPKAGQGTHTYLPGGGLINGTLPEGGLDAGGADAGPDGGVEGGATVPLYETGWDVAWETLPGTQQAWANALVCDASYSTWTLSPGSAGDALPINCVTWAEADAFCIWDGGFLPSEAEWAYVDTGGAAEQPYPWGTASPGNDANLAVYGCLYGAAAPGTCTGPGNLAPVGSVAAGNQALFGQSDLAGNVSEWLLDWYASPYLIASCSNCASTAPAQPTRALRGGAFYDPVTALSTSARFNLAPGDRGANLGFRCARPPVGADP